MIQRTGPIVLVICDGWGVGAVDPLEVRRRGDAVAMAHTPVRDGLVAAHPWSLLKTSGESVGLPEGQMGNSEVGHLNLGAGRIVHQDVTRISRSIDDGSFFTNPALEGLERRLRQSRGDLHVIGLCSDGGVHSHVSHLWALLDWAERAGISVRVHAVTDGRDASPTSGLAWIRQLEARLARAKRGPDGLPDFRMATVSGRYYAMDRDRRWERTEVAYRAIAEGAGPGAATASGHVEACYASGLTDEFLPPAVVSPVGSPRAVGPGGASAPGGRDGIRPGDAIFFLNFRADRLRQILAPLADSSFRHFSRPRGAFARIVAMTPVHDDFAHPVAFPAQRVHNGLGEVLSRARCTQLRVAETEKYPHVTYFFNGGVEKPFAGEDRLMTPSPRVATYDLQPEMSAREVTEALLARLAERRHDFVLVNYANADMVGHTGSLRAAIRAVETVDECVGRVVDAVAGLGGACLVTADHGNAERMIGPDGSPFTAHTTGPVRFIARLPDGSSPVAARDGLLADVAPTVLGLMGLPLPREMTGTSLLAPDPPRR